MEPRTETRSHLHAAAVELAAALKTANARIVFAESCTAGLVSATLASVPGISNFLCGSAVTYREDTKVQWIDVSADTIRDIGVVSGEVATQMAVGVLKATPEAEFAVAITGHLGPNAPADLDGIVYVGTAARDVEPRAERHRLTTRVDANRIRIERQYLAATVVLRTAEQLIRLRNDAHL